MANNTNTNTEPGYWFTTIREIKEANRASGHHWFDKDTLDYFGSRIGNTVYGGRYFITSEQDRYGAWNGRRLYTIRMANADGTIETVGEFGQYATNADARKALTQILRDEFLLGFIAGK